VFTEDVGAIVNCRTQIMLIANWLTQDRTGFPRVWEAAGVAGQCTFNSLPSTSYLEDSITYSGVRASKSGRNALSWGELCNELCNDFSLRIRR